MTKIANDIAPREPTDELIESGADLSGYMKNARAVPAADSSQDLQQRITDAIANPKNLGEMENADSVGTAGSADCGDMLRMWVKFKDVGGRKVIDRATFQTFGCETAIAVASVATELIAGKTAAEALSMSGADLAAPLGALPPMKIHCAQLVEGALRSALAPIADQRTTAPQPAPAKDSRAPTLFDALHAGAAPAKGVRVVLKQTSEPDSVP